MQIEIQIPKAVLFDVKYTVEQATNFAKKEVALGFYMQKGVSVALCSQIAGMSEKEFLVEVKDGSTFYSHSPFDLKYNIHRHHPPPDFHIPLLVT